MYDFYIIILMFLRYLRYFLYLAGNWNLRLAFYVLRHEIRGEKKYGIQTTGADELKRLKKTGVDTSHATLYMPVVYPVLEELLERMPQDARPHFTDIGCGKGRAMCVAAHYGFTMLTGIDFSKDFCTAATAQLQKTAARLPGTRYKIIHNDAFYFDIPDDTCCIFLFNPFDDVIMSGVVNNILDSLERRPRKLYVLYSNPVHQRLFAEAGFKPLFSIKKMDYLEAVAMVKE